MLLAYKFSTRSTADHAILGLTHYTELVRDFHTGEGVVFDSSRMPITKCKVLETTVLVG